MFINTMVVILAILLGTGSSYVETDYVEKKYSSVVRKVDSERPLYGTVITLDPGHGLAESYSEREPMAPGTDKTGLSRVYGTKGVSTGIPEHVLTLNIALKLKTELEKLGSTVYLTREDENGTLSNKERAIFGNDVKSDLVIRIHADGFLNRSVSGSTAMIPSDFYVKDEKLLEKSKGAAEIILYHYTEKTGMKNRGVVSTEDLVFFNWSSVPNILIELGFMSNPNDDTRLNNPDFQSLMVSGIVEGVKEYILKYE